jgi:hypothetical protein
VSRDKPVGTSGPVVFTGDSIEWQVNSLPADKAGRELFVAELLVNAKLIKEESDPSLRPFSSLTQNEENDLDFGVLTAEGPKLLELAEFAPLKEFGPRFGNAPHTLDQSRKFDLALELISKKSSHQGGPGRILVIYTTEHGFELDGMTMELLRRECTKSPPRFDRIYNLVPVAQFASVSEIYPSKPHFALGSWTDDELRGAAVMHSHPAVMTVIHGPGFVQAVGKEGSQAAINQASADPNLSIGKMRRAPKPDEKDDAQPSKA